MVDPHSNLILDLREITDSPQGLHNWILDKIWEAPSLVLLVPLEKPMFLDQSNASDVEDGVIPKDFSHHV